MTEPEPLVYVDDERLLKAVRFGLDRNRASRARREESADLRKRQEILTARELQVLRCMIAGALNKQTAACLGIAERYDAGSPMPIPRRCCAGRSGYSRQTAWRLRCTEHALRIWGVSAA